MSNGLKSRREVNANMPREKSFEDEIMLTIEEVRRTIGAHSFVEESEAERKLTCLGKVLDEEAQEIRFLRPRVFVSFAGSTGQRILTPLLREINKLRTGTMVNFEALHGMAIEGNPEVMRGILGEMQRCCVFVGIMTKEHQLMDDQDEEGGRFAPGHWLQVEMGMAIALGMRVVLLVEEGVHKKFWIDTLGNWKQAKFSWDRLGAGLRDAAKLIGEHYADMQNRRRSGG